MKKVIYLFLILNSYAVFSQTVIREELTENEIQYLGNDIVGGFLKPTSEDFEKSLQNPLINYEFVLEYDNNLIYRGSINRPSYSDYSSAAYRRKIAVCLDYNQFDSETKLELTEGRQFEVKEFENGKKYFVSSRLEIIWKDKMNNKWSLNGKLGKRIKLKLYKTTIQ